MKSIKYDIIKKIFQYEELSNINIDVVEDNFNHTFFDKFEFHEYHQKNCEKVYRILNFKKSKVVGIYYLGIRGREAFIPYSSPFSQILLSKEISYEEIISIIQGMEKVARELKLNSINISLPPFIYNKEIEKQFLMLINYGFKIKYIDINHYFDLTDFISIEDFVSKLQHAQRKNYKRVINQKLNFYKIENSNFYNAFEVIEINRKERGYPLRMDKNQVKDILDFKNSEVDFFVVENKDKEKIAAAMVYKINDKVYQVIYWGHIEEYSQQRPMSLLTVCLCEHYKNKGIDYLDIGPSSEHGEISIGLAQFKVNMGCRETSKFTLRLDL